MASNMEPFDIFIRDDEQMIKSPAHPYEPSEKDPVINGELRDKKLRKTGGTKIWVEFQTRPESKDHILIVWEHNNKFVKAGKIDVTQGITSCTMKYSAKVQGTWTVHIVDLHFGKLAVSQCEVTLDS